MTHSAYLLHINRIEYQKNDGQPDEFGCLFIMIFEFYSDKGEKVNKKLKKVLTKTKIQVIIKQ